MIFVTVGTHEQPFDRLIAEIDALKRDGVIREDVFIQTGYSTYTPKYCRWDKLISYVDMVKNVEQARIVITHGGPASFLMPLHMGKIPVVVPRQSRFGEHINDHQLVFGRELLNRKGNILLVEDVSELRDVLVRYEALVKKRSLKLVSNNTAFNEQIEKIAKELLQQ